jgi:hypothetical protein
MHVSRFHTNLLALLAALAVSTAGASARGVTLIQQYSGKTQTYGNVRLHLDGKTLWVQNRGKDDELAITQGACSFVKSVERCLPDTVVLHQRGKMHQIPLSHGTVYFNLTNAEQSLPLSTESMAPHTVIVLFRTQRGTYVTIKGTLDEVAK